MIQKLSFWAEKIAVPTKCYSNLVKKLNRLRNIGICAHIDSGKTTLTERVLFYTGKIKKMHEVRGKDGVGAKMDSMELEREKGITIQSAATFATWRDADFNIIDTPGHVDFTIEVERSMRVLDGAILVLCAASRVQSQTLTVSRQMDRYHLPRIVFVNKLDRQGADASKAVTDLKEKLGLHCALLQVPVGKEKKFGKVVDLVKMRSISFEGDDGDKVVVQELDNLKEFNTELKTEVELKRHQLVEALAEVDENMEEIYLSEKEPTEQELEQAIRRATIKRVFVPVMLGSAVKNKGVQPLMDAVAKYLPAPEEKEVIASDKKLKGKETKVQTETDGDKMLCYAFKLEESAFGQLTWVRMYQGILRKGDYIYEIGKAGVRSAKKPLKIRVGKLVKMNSNEYEEINKIEAGDIAALFGVECDSGTTFGDKNQSLVLGGMRVPEPVVTLAVQLKNVSKAEKFNKAMKRFVREDPTFRYDTDPETKEAIISGMGELHLEIYKERLLREYGVETIMSAPRVSYRERITVPVRFNYTHKKQTGGRGQFARIIGRIEKIEEDDEAFPNQFVNSTKGMNIPPGFIPSIEKGFLFCVEKGFLINSKMQGIRFIIEDGVTHEVDSSDWAFYQAAIGAFRQAMESAGVVIYEPIVSVQIYAPAQFQGAVVNGLNKRQAMISDVQRIREQIVVNATVALQNMFGYSVHLRSATEGKGEFSMEYKQHCRVSASKQKSLISQFQKY